MLKETGVQKQQNCGPKLAGIPNGGAGWSTASWVAKSVERRSQRASSLCALTLSEEVHVKGKSGTEAWREARPFCQQKRLTIHQQLQHTFSHHHCSLCERWWCDIGHSALWPQSLTKREKEGGGPPWNHEACPRMWHELRLFAIKGMNDWCYSQKEVCFSSRQISKMDTVASLHFLFLGLVVVFSLMESTKMPRAAISLRIKIF